MVTVEPANTRRSGRCSSRANGSSLPECTDRGECATHAAWGSGGGSTDGEPRDHMGSKAVTRRGSDGSDAPWRGDAGKQGLPSPLA